ncbi:unnamed protein product, partial [Pelagomonas calceolata]
RRAAQGSAASTSAKPAKDVVLAKPLIRHERAAVLREIFDSLDDGGRPRDFQISRAEYVRLMGTRGVAAGEANATCRRPARKSTSAKLQHYAYTKSIELIADSFKEIDLQDGARRREFERYQSPSRTRDRQLTGKDVRFYLLGAGLSKDQAVRVWEQLDENGNGKVSYPE